MIDKTWAEFLDQHHLLKIKNLKKQEFPFVLYEAVFDFIKDYDQKKIPPIQLKQSLMRHEKKERTENPFKEHPKVFLLKYFIQREHFILDKIQSFFIENWDYDISINKAIDLHSHPEDIYLVFHNKIYYRVIVSYQKRKESLLKEKDFLKWMDIILPAYFEVYYTTEKIFP